MLVDISLSQAIIMFIAGFFGAAGAALCKTLIIYAKKRLNHDV